jgi:hypothetical protein
MSKRVRKSSKPAKPKAYFLLGANEYAKPRAARFSADADPELLAKARRHHAPLADRGDQ